MMSLPSACKADAVTWPFVIFPGFKDESSVPSVSITPSGAGMIELCGEPMALRVMVNARMQAARAANKRLTAAIRDQDVIDFIWSVAS